MFGLIDNNLSGNPEDEFAPVSSGNVTWRTGVLNKEVTFLRSDLQEQKLPAGTLVRVYKGTMNPELFGNPAGSAPIVSPKEVHGVPIYVTELPPGKDQFWLVYADTPENKALIENNKQAWVADLNNKMLRVGKSNVNWDTGLGPLGKDPNVGVGGDGDDGTGQGGEGAGGEGTGTGGDNQPSDGGGEGGGGGKGNGRGGGGGGGDGGGGGGDGGGSNAGLWIALALLALLLFGKKK